MSRRSAQHSGKARPKDVPFYADPERPGRARHSTCFPKGIAPAKRGYPRAEGPCWVCEVGAQSRIIHLTHLQMVADMDRLGRAMERTARIGFALAMEIRSGTFTGQIERTQLDSALGELVDKFRAAWDEAATLAGRGGRPIEKPPRPRTPQEMQSDALWAGIICAQAGLNVGAVPGLRDRDPRRIMTSCPLNRGPTVDARHLEETSGQAAYAARRLRNAASQMRKAVKEHRGRDADDELRHAVEALGASSQQVANAALLMMEPSGQMTAQLEARAKALAVKTRVRIHEKRHASDDK